MFKNPIVECLESCYLEGVKKYNIYDVIFLFRYCSEICPDVEKSGCLESLGNYTNG